MKKIILKIRNFINKGLAPYEARGFRSGFVLLFAVTIASILLSIAIGVANVAYKEIRFGTSARDTNDAFFSADTAIECALLYDKDDPKKNAFIHDATIMNCAGSNVTISRGSDSWSFVISGLGSLGLSCAKVTLTKTTVRSDVFSVLISKGYNVGDAACNSTSTNRIEREIKLKY